ncbi:MAG: hypothetical protein K9I85_06625, partial [Saprospiraceae bacterium]|nr:hypothetical protein [Saprospiraceae bacterium]
DVSCAGASDGSIQLTVTGGTPGYTYLWSTGATTPDLSGLNAGVYAVTVTDQNGCTKTGSYPINEPSALILSITKTDVSCAGASDGSIQLTVTGGTPGYTYLWSTGATTPDLAGLNAGVYAVTVTDQNGCTQTGSYPINEPSALILNITKTDVSCAGASDGSIQLTVTGGTIPYTYTWSNGASSKDIQNISGGTYAVTVSDGNGCSNSKTVVIDEPTPISLTIVSSDPDCIGGNDGSTEVTATGGSAPYTYLWNDPAQHTTALCSGLGMGVYSVTVTDQHGCTAVEEVTISDGQDDCQIDIGDFVWLDSDRDGIQDSNEYGENGILVKLVQTGPDGDYGTWDDLVIDSVYTSGFGFNTGYYLFTDVQPGTYSICFVIDTSAFQFTLMDEGGDDGKDSDPHPGTGCIEAFTILPDSKDNLTFDAGIHARCVNVTSGGSIGYDEVLCKPGADPENIQNIISPAGGLGQMEYLWLQSDSDPMYYPGNPQWEAIPNSNSPEFDPLTIDVTTYFIRCARREGCLNYPGETNIVTKTIEDPLAEISGPSGPLCVDEGYFFMATSNGPNATYEWDFGPHGHPQTASGLVVNNVSWDISGIQTVTLTVTVSGCEASISTPFEIEACGGKHVIQSFSAYVNINHDVDLKWFSEKYQDEHVFVIERSIDGVDFQYVATVKGEVNQDLWYPYRDENPIWGENYYRLRMVSIQGVMAISEVKRVVVKEVDMFNVSIFPNPASTQFEIRLLETRPQEARVIFYDLLGREIHSTTIEPGQKSVFVNCQDWPDGLVIAWVIQEGKRPFSIPLQKIK